MKWMTPVGLIAAGRISESALPRLPELCTQIGPVLAASPRIASRFVRTLKAGHAVGSAAELEGCRLILLCAPETGLKDVVAWLRESPLRWKGRSVAVLESGQDLGPLAPLRKLGAAVCLLSPVAGMESGVFCLEGDAPACREAKLVLRHARLGVLELAPGTQALYQTAQSCISSLLPPLLEASGRCLARSGLSQRQARRLLERWVEQQIQGYVAAGRKSWANAGTAARRPGLRRQIEALQVSDPATGRFFVESLRISMNLMGLEGRWLEEFPASGKDARID